MKNFVLLTCLLAGMLCEAQQLTATFLGRYTDGREGASEIVTYDSASAKLIITNSAVDSIDIISVADYNAISKVAGVDVTLYGGGINSVVNLDGYFAAAIEDTVKQNPGKVVFFDLMGTFINELTVGALPDMITVTPDMTKLLVANEGEPNDAYTVDPAGSVSIIDLTPGIASLTSANVKTLTFDNAPASIPGGLNKPGTPWNIDLEPEYIAVNNASTIAAAICQEANVLITIDLTADTILGYMGLGFKDFNTAGNGIDASDQDGGINIQNWPVKGVYQPDAIDMYTVNNTTYIVTANEGDGRDYSGYSSEVRVDDLTLDTSVFTNATTLQQTDQLGRLKTFTSDVIGDANNDNLVEEIYAYGGRSMTIWDLNGNVVWDSGDGIEQFMATNYPSFFNCNDGLASKADSRSDDKGPEPEAVTVGKIGNNYYAFLGLERQGGVMIYDVTDPQNPAFKMYLESFDTINGTSVDIAPEGIVFIPASESHDGQNLLIYSNEISGTTVMYALTEVTTSVQTISNPMNVTIFPNPNNGQFSIQANQRINAYRIFSPLGSVLQRNQVNQTNFNVTIDSYQAGMYIIQLDTDNGSVSLPIIKK